MQTVSALHAVRAGRAAGVPGAAGGGGGVGPGAEPARDQRRHRLLRQGDIIYIYICIMSDLYKAILYI